MIVLTVLAIKNGSIPMSRRRGKTPAAEIRVKRTKDKVPGPFHLHTEVGRLAVTHLHHHDIWVLAKNRAQAICKCQPDMALT